MSGHPLDRPIWHALATGWSGWAQGNARARRIRPDYNVFGAAADRSPDSLAALGDLVEPGRDLWLVEREPWPPPPGCRVVRTATIVQMLFDDAEASAIGADLPAGLSLAPLGEDDSAEMRELAAATRPGPFLRHTNRLGRFVGIRDSDGRLVAMAGERMALPAHREVSAVCTLPQWRGKGLAALLIVGACRRMMGRGERPFLTSYADNGAAIGLYERLGFRTRADMTVTVLARTDVI